MNDKELLEAAAKSVGLEHRGYVDDFFDPEMNVSAGLMYGCPTFVWNPLKDDGDAFRLMSDLMLVVKIYRNCVLAENIDDYTSRSDVDCDKRNEATRRAIVKLAAEIGRDME